MSVAPPVLNVAQKGWFVPTSLHGIETHDKIIMSVPLNVKICIANKTLLKCSRNFLLEMSFMDMKRICFSNSNIYLNFEISKFLNKVK
jgi:hypothetical protein